MKFRRIYWVTEQLDDEGHSDVTGVYTSIPDLVEIGLGLKDYSPHQKTVRLSLCELDASKPPLVTLFWNEYDKLESLLKPFVDDGEMTHEDVMMLVDALKARFAL
ncbi:MAG: hypothetical protein KatS3mg015_0595 [Fimbriimonadales bacterium]|nr:MAG: hypothetical protein KatS3mg015_0595 [Fimbriimonadales bacterium]